MDGNDIRATESNWNIRDRKGLLSSLHDVGADAHRHSGRALCCQRELLDGCNVVVNSPYSRVFGVPMSYFGFIYYLYMFALAARLAFEPFSNSLRFRAVLYAGVGAASSLYFMYLQLGFIQAVCSYCLISAVTTFLLLLLAIWHFRATRHSAIGT
jgi:uncharacterized membrane protein